MDHLTAPVLIIEDDPILGPSLKQYLERRGFEATWLPDERKWEGLSLSEFGVVVLDLMLPHLPGEVILSEMKKRAPELPVLILTAKHGLEAKKLCFELGADDYLVKPFEVLELELRLRALLRRAGPRELYHVGGVMVDIRRGVVIRDGEEIVPSRRTWDLLLYFLRHRGRVIPKEELLSRVWKDVVVNEETLRSYVRELRKILPRGVLETHKGRGYLLKDAS